MKIISLYCKNHYEEWEISEMEFSDLTLLVGVSGVGKTQILEAIRSIKKIAEGGAINGFEWKIIFSEDTVEYVWEGAFSLLEDDFLKSFPQLLGDNSSFAKNIQYERLWKNNYSIIERTVEKSLFINKELPKLPSNKSIVNTLAEESIIQPVLNALNNVCILQETMIRTHVYSLSSFEDYSINIHSISNSNFDTQIKLFLLFSYFSKKFNSIKSDFIDIFPQVKDIRFVVYSKNNRDSFSLQLKEKGVERWVFQHKISSGMFKTLMYLTELHLAPKNSVILIDEFENSLGVNCIDILAKDFLFERDDIQFILTSHHPYIINKIPAKYWKIVTRKGGTIQTYDATQFDLGRSRHENFLKLSNLPQYKQGIPLAS